MTELTPQVREDTAPPQLTPEVGVLDLRDDTVEHAMSDQVPQSAEVGEHELTQKHHELPRSREEVLRQLLGTDYEFALESGLLDIFETAEESDRGDALLHILVGDTLAEDESGGRIPQGFHHEPSARVIGRNTRAEHELVDALNEKGRKTHEIREFEPWKARGITVDGVRKFRVDKHTETGEVELKPSNNSMYPNEYDALTVIQSINAAYKSATPTGREPLDGKVEMIGYAPMVDGAARMPIRLIVNQETGKVITAIPVVKGRLIQANGQAQKTRAAPAYGGQERFVTKLPPAQTDKMLGTSM